MEGHIIVPYTGYDKHIVLIQKNAEIGAAKLWYDKPKKQFYLLVTLSIETADPTPETHTGVDIGIRYLAVTATRSGEQSFYTGKRVVPKANHYARLRKRLQKKGTRSATRRLVAISGRERRLKQDWIGTGQLSVVPGPSGSDVSSAEAKAARLKRYAELRWSLDASPA